jgi:hypothetical protein
MAVVYPMESREKPSYVTPEKIIRVYYGILNSVLTALHIAGDRVKEVFI